MQLYLIRHTKVAVEPGICYGQSDVEPAGTFQEEAEIIKKQISGIQFDKIYSSPLSRCKKLSEHLFGSGIKYDDRLMELNFGDWELQKWNELKNPTVDEWMNDFVNVPCPNGESFNGMYQRIKSFLAEIQEQKSDHVAIISHGGTMRCILAYINNEELKDAFKREIEYGETITVQL